MAIHTARNSFSVIMQHSYASRAAAPSFSCRSSSAAFLAAASSSRLLRSSMISRSYRAFRQASSAVDRSINALL